MICPVCGLENAPNAAACADFGTALPTAAGTPLPPNTTLQNGRYIIEKVLWQGGFTIIYKGMHAFMKVEVAITEPFPSEDAVRSGNVVKPQQASSANYEALKSRFIDTARLEAKLSQGHWGIVSVYDLFEENNTVYQVTEFEFLRGKPLSKLLEERGGFLPEEEAVDYILKVASILKHIHLHGWLHRNVNPDNIFVCESGRVVLQDFSCATQRGKEKHEVILTSGYAPLEQYASSSRQDTYTDIYGLGATLYYLLTEQVPIPAPDRVSDVELPSVSKVSRSLWCC